jgi:hypothetical protein
MPHLSITPDDATTLRELLEAALVDISREISHTDSREFRRVLVEREKAIERLLRETRDHEREGPALGHVHEREAHVQ